VILGNALEASAVRQLPLFEAPLIDGETIVTDRPLCVYQRQQLHGRCKGARAVLGIPRDLGGCINRTIRCLTCGSTGEESTCVDDVPDADQFFASKGAK
jgi:hypothetical protein